MAETFKIEGLKELQKSLDRLGDDMRSRISTKAVVAGARVVKRAAKVKAAQQPTLADAPYTHAGVTYSPGHVSRNIGTSKVWVGRFGAGVSVGVKSTAGNGFAGRIASLNEFGTVNMAAQPFMRPGFESSKGAAVVAIVAAVREGIEKA